MSAIRRRSLALCAVVAVFALLAAACSDSTEEGGSTATTPPLADLGPFDQATGTPIKVGFITEGKSAVIDNSGMEAAAQAAADYVNEHLGGVKGHPIEIVLCQTQGTPAGSADCAHKMVNEKVPVVLGATPAAPAPIIEVLEDAGIPYFADAVVEMAGLLSEGTYVLSNMLGYVVAPIALAQQHGYERVATILVDIPAAVGPIKMLGDPLFQKVGVANTYVAVPLGTPDMTPQVQLEMQQNPDLFVVVGDAAFCTAGLSALRTLGYDGEIFINSQCYTPDLHAGVSGGIGGVMVGSASSMSPDDAEVQLYQAVMATYAPDVDPASSATPEGFRIMLAFARAMNGGLEGEPSAEAVKTALATAPPQPLPLFEGQTFRCDRSLFTLTPSICSSAIAVTTMNDDGTPGSAEALDILPVLNG